MFLVLHVDIKNLNVFVVFCDAFAFANSALPEEAYLCGNVNWKFGTWSGSVQARNLGWDLGCKLYWKSSFLSRFIVWLIGLLNSMNCIVFNLGQVFESRCKFDVSSFSVGASVVLRFSHFGTLTKYWHESVLECCSSLEDLIRYCVLHENWFHYSVWWYFHDNFSFASHKRS